MPLNLIPATGMKFTKYDKAWDFYNNYARGQNTGQMPTLSAQEKGSTSRLCQIITGDVRRHQKGLAAMQRLESKKGRMANL